MEILEIQGAFFHWPNLVIILYLNRSINTSSFEAVYDSTPSSVLDLAHLPLPKKLNPKATDWLNL